MTFLEYTLREGDGQYGFDLDPATEPKLKKRVPCWIIEFTYDHTFHKIKVWNTVDRKAALRNAIFSKDFPGDEKNKRIAYANLKRNPDDYSLRMKLKQL